MSPCAEVPRRSDNLQPPFAKCREHAMFVNDGNSADMYPLDTGGSWDHLDRWQSP